MSEYVLPTGSDAAADRFAGLPDFVAGYIEAMFFTEANPDSEDLAEASLEDLAPEAWDTIVADCEAWQAENACLLKQAYDRDYDEEQAGRDYWFTRNGHGVGFWDRGALMAEGLGDRLSDAAGRSERYLYRGDDGLIYYA